MGPLFSQAELRLTEAREQLELFRVSLSQGVGRELVEAGAFDIEAGGIFEPVEKGLTRVEQFLKATQDLLGFPESKTYLVILQNQNEIRATGGFIGATVEAHITRGTLGEVIYADSTTIDPTPLINNPSAPEPLFWYLWMGRLLFRDANWNPHFPASAETLADLYERGQGSRVDGVIATNKLVGLDLVAVLPGITVPEVEGFLDREQARQYTEGERPYPCSSRHVSTRDKRCFSEDLFQAVLDRLNEGVTPDERRALITLLQDQLERKNILIYTFTQDPGGLLAENGWDGAVPDVAQDFLMVIDSSLPGHTTLAVTRSWDYRVDLTPHGESNAQLLLRYRNDRSSAAPDCRQAAEGGGGCYWNYFRLFLPRAASDVIASPAPLHEGSEKLIWGHRDPDSGRVLEHADAGLEGLTEVGGYITVEPDSILTIPVTYQLGPEVVRQVGEGIYEYRLLLVKQPGMEQDQVRVRVRLPEGSKLVTSAPSGITMEGNVLEFLGVLRENTEIVVIFAME